MKKTLITAYAINPDKGSEDGTGWNWILQVAKKNKLIVITRENNKPYIEKYIQENTTPENSNIEFQYYDLPRWSRFWKRGGQGALLYYQLWIIGAAIFSLKYKTQINIAHHLNFHNDYIAPIHWMFYKKTVWGPIGHHPMIPFQYSKKFGIRFTITEWIKWSSKSLYRILNPINLLAYIKTNHIIGINSDVKTGLKNISYKPAVASENNLKYRCYNEKFEVLFVGRLEPLKGIDIAIESYYTFYNSLTKEEKQNTSFTIIGSGTLEKKIEHFIVKNNADTYIKKIPWIEQKDVLKHYSKSKVFLFPSHEGAGMVVAEALSFGLPVVCFNNAGPGELTPENSNIKTTYSTKENSILEFSKILKHLFSDASFYEQEMNKAKDHFKKNLEWKNKGFFLESIYTKLSNEKV